MHDRAADDRRANRTQLHPGSGRGLSGSDAEGIIVAAVPTRRPLIAKKISLLSFTSMPAR